MTISIKLPGEYGELEFWSFADDGQQGLVAANLKYEGPPFVRIHSSCVFSEAFRTSDCDCSRQLQSALKFIQEHGGIIIYLYQEGRGIGLADKIRAIDLEQRKKLGTVTAFANLGHDADPRNYEGAVDVIRGLGIKKIRLATNNPKKIVALQAAGIEVERTELLVETNPLIDEYLERKRRELGHHG